MDFRKKVLIGWNIVCFLGIINAEGILVDDEVLIRVARSPQFLIPWAGQKVHTENKRKHKDIGAKLTENWTGIGPKFSIFTDSVSRKSVQNYDANRGPVIPSFPFIGPPILPPGMPVPPYPSYPYPPIVPPGVELRFPYTPPPPNQQPSGDSSDQGVSQQ